jgi:hypothetical protein
MEVDIDAFVDFLAGSALDDTRVTGLAVLRHEGRRLGVAFGYNRDQSPRYGVFDFEVEPGVSRLQRLLDAVDEDLLDLRSVGRTLAACMALSVVVTLRLGIGGREGR